MEKLLLLVWISFAVASISYTISMTAAFKWLRDLNIIFFKDVIKCPYCLSHYIAFAILAIITYSNEISITIPFTGCFYFNFIITWFSVIGITAIMHKFILSAYEPVLKQNLLDRLNTKK